MEISKLHTDIRGAVSEYMKFEFDEFEYLKRQAYNKGQGVNITIYNTVDERIETYDFERYDNGDFVQVLVHLNGRNIGAYYPPANTRREVIAW